MSRGCCYQNPSFREESPYESFSFFEYGLPAPSHVIPCMRARTRNSTTNVSKPEGKCIGIPDRGRLWEMEGGGLRRESSRTGFS